MTSGEFVLDQRLAQDATEVCNWKLSRILLMNDRRFPWLILVPRRTGAVEAFDLSADEQGLLWREVNAAARALKRITGCRKINIGALGNIVSQLHVHVVARRADDAAWPGPVWGKGTAEPYAGDEFRSRLAEFKKLLGEPAD